MQPTKRLAAVVLWLVSIAESVERRLRAAVIALVVSPGDEGQPFEV